MDVLKIVEEALERARQQFGSHAGESQNEEMCEQALTALRGLEWRPIAEMERLETHEVVCGSYSITGEWVTTRFQTAKAACHLGYTHFCRPVLPTPPKREGK